jgi:hypothetical protein
VGSIALTGVEQVLAKELSWLDDVDAVVDSQLHLQRDVGADCVPDPSRHRTAIRAIEVAFCDAAADDDLEARLL